MIYPRWRWPRFFNTGLRAQILKELLLTLRDPEARIFLTISPIMQLLLFTFAATLEVQNAVVVVHNQDGGRWSQELMADLSAARFIGDMRTVTGNGDLHNAIQGREALLAIVIPPDFSRRVAAGEPAPLQVIIDGRRANAGQVALGYIDTIASRFGTRFLPPSQQPPEMIAVRHWFNPNLIFIWFIVPALVATMAMMVPLMVAAMSIARERELGTFDQLLVSPTSPTEIIVAKALPAVVLGSLSGLVMVAAGVFGFGVPFNGSLLALGFCTLLFILSVVGLGLMISSVCATQQQGILGTFATTVPMVLLSGFATPVENMPDILQLVAETIPAKHYLIILQGSFLKAMPMVEIWRNAWPLAVISVVTLVVAVGLVKSRLR